MKDNRLYTIRKGGTDCSENLCGGCMKDYLEEETPLTSGESVEELEPSWEEGYVCAHCGINYISYYEREGRDV